MKILVLVMCLACAAAVAQPECFDDNHCQAGHFCARVVSKCVSCVDCAEYNRHPADDVGTCVKAAEECGACLQGYKLGYTSLECVDVHAPEPAAAPAGEGAGVHLYVWLPIVIVLLVVVAVLLAFKLYSNFWKCAESRPQQSFDLPEVEAPLHVRAPPFNPAVNNNNHPASAPLDKRTDFAYDEDGARGPHVKRSDSLHARSGHRERDTSQEARPFSYPNYIRPPQPPPPTYDEALSTDSVPPGSPAPEPSVEEETVPSDWTPDQRPPQSSLNLPELLSQARDYTLIRQPERQPRERDPGAPPAKLPRLMPAGAAQDKDSRDGTTVVALGAAPPSGHTVGSNGVLLGSERFGPGGSAPSTPGGSAGPSPASSPPPTDPPAPPPPNNIIINITQQLNNLIGPKIRFDEHR